ncbi:peroxidase 1 [Artemisia annua]|uniref:peroxidase n=1 Tax=Artemisia annua TaxID=35608 RepID=A0A2U1NBB6_ARTAN|nr:peroxidase 1 [Artemisia annua]
MKVGNICTYFAPQVDVDCNEVCTLYMWTPSKVSTAQMHAMGHHEDSWAGGPSYSVELGRFDWLSSTAASVGGKMLKPNQNLDQLNALFTADGLTQADMIALSGFYFVSFVALVKTGHDVALINRFHVFNIYKIENELDLNQHVPYLVVKDASSEGMQHPAVASHTKKNVYLREDGFPVIEGSNINTSVIISRCRS